MCWKITGLLVLVAGVALLLFGLGNLDGPTAHLVGGGAFTLVGLSKLVHSFGMCGACKKDCKC